MSAPNTFNSTTDQIAGLAETQTLSHVDVNKGLLLLSVILLVLSVFTSAQANNGPEQPSGNKKIQVLFEMQAGNYGSALANLDSSGEQTDASIDHMKGVCYFELNMLDEAEFHLTDAIENMVDEAQSWNPEGEEAPIHAMFFLGKTLMAQERYEEAEFHLSQFLVSLHMMDDSEAWLIQETEIEIERCRESYTGEDQADF